MLLCPSFSFFFKRGFYVLYSGAHDYRANTLQTELSPRLLVVCDCFPEAKHKHSFSDNRQKWTRFSALMFNCVTISVTCCPDLSRSKQSPEGWHFKHSEEDSWMVTLVTPTL